MIPEIIQLFCVRLKTGRIDVRALGNTRRRASMNSSNPKSSQSLIVGGVSATVTTEGDAVLMMAMVVGRSAKAGSTLRQHANRSAVIVFDQPELYFTFIEASAAAKRLWIKTRWKYRALVNCQIGRRPRLPSDPSRACSGSWPGWPAFLGVGKESASAL